MQVQQEVGLLHSTLLYQRGADEFSLTEPSTTVCGPPRQLISSSAGASSSVRVRSVCSKPPEFDSDCISEALRAGSPTLADRSVPVLLLETRLTSSSLMSSKDRSDTDEDALRGLVERLLESTIRVSQNPSVLSERSPNRPDRNTRKASQPRKTLNTRRKGPPQQIGLFRHTGRDQPVLTRQTVGLCVSRARSSMAGALQSCLDRDCTTVSEEFSTRLCWTGPGLSPCPSCIPPSKSRTSIARHCDGLRIAYGLPIATPCAQPGPPEDSSVRSSRATCSPHSCRAKESFGQDPSRKTCLQSQQSRPGG